MYVCMCTPTCVCDYVCMHVYMHTHVHTYIHTCIRIKFVMQRYVHAHKKEHVEKRAACGLKQAMFETNTTSCLGYNPTYFPYNIGNSHAMHVKGAVALTPNLSST